jgi:hypothetical protein
LIIAKFEVSNPNIEHAFEQVPSFSRPVSIGLPNQRCRCREGGNQIERGWQMDRRLPTQKHDGSSPSVQGLLRSNREAFSIESHAGGGIPTRSAGDAEITTQVASAQRNAKSRDQLRFIADLGLGQEPARLRASAAKATLAHEAIHAAMMRAKMAIRQRRSGGGRSGPGKNGASSA